MSMYQYKIFHQIELVSVYLYDTVDMQELMEMNMSIYSDLNQQPHFNGLCDTRDAELNITLNQMRQIHQSNEVLNVTHGRWAHIVNNPRNTALSMEYALAARDIHEVKIVHDIEEAENFLKIKDLNPYILRP